MNAKNFKQGETKETKNRIFVFKTFVPFFAFCK